MISIAKVSISREEEDAVLRVLRSGILTQGREIEQFEEEFASYIGTKFAVAASNGTAALDLALFVLGIGRGDEVITTPLSFIASTSSILHVGARPVFVDILSDGNIDTSKIENKISSRTKAILPVHLYGNPADLDMILKIAKKYKLKVIEDSCQAHGAEFGNKKVGSFGDVSCFSFYATKNMTTGEGGMITMNDSKLAEKAKMFRSHGSKSKYSHEFLGYNLRMTEMQAAIGRIQLRKLDNNNKRRIENASYLNNLLSKIKGIQIPRISKNKKSVFHQYSIFVTGEFPLTRDRLMQYLKKKGIDSSVHYPLAINKQEVVKNLGYSTQMPNAEKLSRHILSLPIHPEVSRKDLDFIGQSIAEVK